MNTFDQILPTVRDVLTQQAENLNKLGALVINRDLNGRVRLVVDEKIRDDKKANGVLDAIVTALAKRLGPHGFMPEHMVFFEEDMNAVMEGAPHFALEGFKDIIVVDRLATDTDWSNIEPVSPGASRIVFFSIKGGVGRSTALAVVAWSLAQAGKRVMVLDLDLESPGLSSSLLPMERRPEHGITDWLVEDLVDNGAAIFESMVSTSDLSHDGEIYVVPAHGQNAGDYIGKLGRAWMPKAHTDGSREPWSKRLNRLLDELENRWYPDVILIDSRAGIDEVASACMTDLGAGSVLLFAIDGEQTWSGYSILLQHWHQTAVVRKIRERLQLVGAMIPEVGSADYFDGLLDRAWDTFTEKLYDEVPPGELSEDHFNFDKTNESAPHFPWPIRWNRGFAALRSVYSRFQGIEQNEVRAIFGPLIDGVQAMTDAKGEDHV